MKQDYEVGTYAFHVVDASREEKLGDKKEKRKIAIRLYYPVTREAAAGKKKAKYMGAHLEEALKKTFKLPKNMMPKNEIEAYDGVDFIEGETFPLVLFSHGYNSYVEANSYLCCDLAASGYIVASVGHAYEAVANEYEDGTYDLFDKKINKMMYDKGFLKALLAQGRLMKMKGSTEELSKAFIRFQNEHTPYIVGRLDEWRLDMLYALQAIKERYGSHLDLTNGVAASGHSLGGATAYFLCQTSDEISCGLNIDGGLFGNYENMTLTKPFFQYACRENWNVESRVLLNRNAPVYTAVFSKMKHIGYLDLKKIAKIKFLVGALDYEIMYRYLYGGHVTFLDKYLKKQDTEVMSSVDPDVVIEVHQ